MLPGWDKLQDLRGGTEAEPAAREIRAITDASTIRQNTDRLIGVRQGIKEGKRMSLLGKMKHLTETAQDFHKETESALDGITAKIALGREKREQAVAKHHSYYDAIIAGVAESTEVIDRLSNGPLLTDGE